MITGYAGASLSILCAHFRPIRSRTEWIFAYALVFVTSVWMIVSSAGVYTSNTFPYENGAIALIVLCKVTIAYTKTALFLLYFRVPSNNASQGADIEESLLEEEEEEEVLSNEMSKEDAVFRWGGAGIQAGGFVGAILFFLLTVPTSVLNHSN